MEVKRPKGSFIPEKNIRRRNLSCTVEQNPKEGISRKQIQDERLKPNHVNNN